ncbi:MAG: methyltransferase domain-containing protein [Planctomycetaceae bacterium]
MSPNDLEQETRIARSYFSDFADDYNSALDGRPARSLLHGIVNRLFRRNTLRARTRVVRDVLARYNIAGKTVLDLGCGPGELAVIAAKMKARVTGVDIVDEMIAIANSRAGRAGVADSVEFRVADLVAAPVDAADVTLLIGVIEYYGNLRPLLSKACRATREVLIVADTRGPYWRRQLRYLLARIKRFRVYYHPPREVADLVGEQGFREKDHVVGHSFTVMVFERTGEASRDG